jgi:hypothetical protein
MVIWIKYKKLELVPFTYPIDGFTFPINNEKASTNL